MKLKPKLADIAVDKVSAGCDPAYIFAKTETTQT